MKQFIPDYYPFFHCLMGDCRHNCCIGWEIDIDEESLERYRRMEGPMGKRLRDNIEDDGENACFRLTGEERCPFLNRDGLCDLILEWGEAALCQICSDHPRFRSFYTDRVETGLGLCCEAAAQLILTRRQPMRLIPQGDAEADAPLSAEEEELLSLRENWFSLLQNRSLSMQERIEKLEHTLWKGKIPLDIAAWADFLLTLERLDASWTDHLHRMRQETNGDFPLPDAEEWEIAWEQLAVYLLYRHLPGALEDGRMTARLAFVAVIWRLLRQMCRAEMAHRGGFSLENLVELARLYSAEIEYSDENMDAILDFIEETMLPIE